MLPDSTIKGGNTAARKQSNNCGADQQQRILAILEKDIPFWGHISAGNPRNPPVKWIRSLQGALAIVRFSSQSWTFLA
jgi:hypothetical protein